MCFPPSEIPLLCCCSVFATPWAAARQAPLSLGFPRQVGCYFLLHGSFPTQGSNPRPLHWQMNSLLLSHQGMHFVYSVFEILQHMS